MVGRGVCLLALLLLQTAVSFAEDVEDVEAHTEVASSNEALVDISQGTELEVLEDENAIPAISLDALDITAFRENIADGKWFIKFYVPWCRHCMQLAPVWDELARKVHSGPHDVNIAKLDCTKQKDTCAAMMVQGFPTLRFFDGGNDTPYKTIRTLDALSAFVERAMKPVLADIDTPDALQEMIATNPAFFLALPPSFKTMSKNQAREDNDPWETPLRTVAEQSKFTVDMFTTSSRAVVEHVLDRVPAGSVDRPARLVAIKGDEIVRFSGGAQQLLIKEFIKIQRFPRVPMMDHVLASTLRKEYPHLLMVVLVVDISADNVDAIQATFKEVSQLKDWFNKFQFVLMDRVKWSLYIEKTWPEITVDAPRIVVMNSQNQMHYTLHANTIVSNPDAVTGDEAPALVVAQVVAELRSVLRGEATFIGGSSFLANIRATIFAGTETFIVSFAALEAEYPSLVQMCIITTLMLIAVMAKQCWCDERKKEPDSPPSRKANKKED